jgi:hypothetical protein
VCLNARAYVTQAADCRDSAKLDWIELFQFFLLRLLRLLRVLPLLCLLGAAALDLRRSTELCWPTHKGPFELDLEPILADGEVCSGGDG